VLATIRASLASALDPTLVDELLETYTEAKRNFYEGGHRLNAVEGGRFCEAAYRLLAQRTTGSITPLGRQLDTEKLTKQLANLPYGSHPDSVRVHIPRGLRVVYDIRNSRDAAHLADGIDPNLQDATLVVSVLDWVLAEFVRLYHGASPDQAQRIVEDLVTRRAPAIQEFGDFLKVLKPDLRAGDHALALLYHCGSAGASLAKLTEWARPPMRANLKRTLTGLTDDKALVHFDGQRYIITATGKQYVDERRLLQP